MPINAFGGGPGSGKTYGVMEHVILPAVANGRFILTNIEGLRTDLIYEYVAANAPKDKIICIGYIRTCDRNAPDEEDFFPDESALDSAMPVPSPDYKKVWGGDLVVIDEATRYWSQGTRVKKTHAYFFREHRHFSNEMGHTCDLVVIDPDISMFCRALKGKIEMSSVTHKPKSIGLNRYVVNLYRQAKTNTKPMQTLGPYKFKPEIYALYKSYSHENAKEQKIDSRQNVLKSGKFIGLCIILIVMVSVSIWSLYRFLGKRHTSTEKPNVEISQKELQNNSSSLMKKQSSFSKDYRISGLVFIQGRYFVTLVDSSGRLIHEPADNFVGSGVFLNGEFDGAKVTIYSGSPISVRSEENGKVLK